MRKYKKYKNLTRDDIEKIRRMYNENIGIRAIARVFKVYVRTIQYHLNKIKNLKQEYTKDIKNKNKKKVFKYLIIDELYTFIKKKENKAYVWSAIAVDTDGNKSFYYHLSRRKDNNALIKFKENLPEVDKVYCDGNMTYSSIFGDKATMKKSVYTNLIESLNSNMRSSIAYLTRKSNKHSKSFTFLDSKLANFFLCKNAI